VSFPHYYCYVHVAAHDSSAMATAAVVQLQVFMVVIVVAVGLFFCGSLGKAARPV